MDSKEVWQMCQSIMIGMEERDLKAAFDTDDVSVIMDMPLETASRKYEEWVQNTDNYQRPLTRGDIVLCSGAYYMIVGYWGDMVHTIDAMSPDGRIETLPKDGCVYYDMHLKIHDIPIGHIQRFLTNLQDRKDKKEVEPVERIRHDK